jgi:hypothetical protein
MQAQRAYLHIGDMVAPCADVHVHSNSRRQPVQMDAEMFRQMYCQHATPLSQSSSSAGTFAQSNVLADVQDSDTAVHARDSLGTKALDAVVLSGRGHGTPRAQEEQEAAACEGNEDHEDWASSDWGMGPDSNAAAATARISSSPVGGASDATEVDDVVNAVRAGTAHTLPLFRCALLSQYSIYACV